MSFKELGVHKIPITLGGKELYLLYNLNAMIYLENYYDDINALLGKKMDEWVVDDVIHLLRSGLMDYYFDENEESINNREFDLVKPSMAGIGRLVTKEGLNDITVQIIEAMIASYPENLEGTDRNF